MTIQRITIIGTGLIGASAGLALRAARFPGEIVGWDRHLSQAQRALERGAVDTIAGDPITAAVTSDLVLTGRAMGADEAYGHGIVSRVVAPEALDDTAWEIANNIAASPKVTVKMARRVLRHLSEPGVRSSMEDELIYQTFINKSSDFAEFRAAKAEGREPHYTGS